MSARPHLQSILETVPTRWVIFDEGGLIQSFSATAERLLGFIADETHNDTSPSAISWAHSRC
jgi:PAS domain S-box-containing protein